MCTHTSSAHVIQTRHPFPSSARGVHMCRRPSSVCLWIIIIGFTVNCLNALNVDGVCANHVHHCASIPNLYTVRELCCNEISVSY